MRVTAPTLGLRGTVGIVHEATDEVLTVQFGPNEDPRTIERSAITAMDVWVGGGDGRGVKGLFAGGIVGGAIGALIGFSAGDDRASGGSFGDWHNYSAGEKAALYGVGLGVVGALIGWAATRSGSGDVWSPVTVSGAEVTLLPLVGGEGAGLHVGFSVPIR